MTHKAISPSTIPVKNISKSRLKPSLPPPPVLLHVTLAGTSDNIAGGGGGMIVVVMALVTEQLSLQVTDSYYTPSITSGVSG